MVLMCSSVCLLLTGHHEEEAGGVHAVLRGSGVVAVPLR